MSSIGSTFAFPQSQEVLTKGVVLTEASPEEDSLQGDKGSGKKKAQRGNSITEV